MNGDAPTDPSTSAFEELLAGNPTGDPVQGEAVVVVPPEAQDDPPRAQITANIRAELSHQVRGEATAVLPANMAARVQGNVGTFLYRPDVIVDADLPPPGAISARQPLVIFEVTAGGSERAAFIEKWQIYHSLPSLKAYVLVDSSRIAATVYRQTGATWESELLQDIDDQVFLPTIHCLLSLETVYRGAFPEREGI